MKLTPNEERAIREAIPVWLSVRQSILSPVRGGTASPHTKFRGDTPDLIFAKHGIYFGKCFSGNHRYGQLEAELRHRATRGEG